MNYTLFGWVSNPFYWRLGGAIRDRSPIDPKAWDALLWNCDCVGVTGTNLKISRMKE